MRCMWVGDNNYMKGGDRVCHRVVLKSGKEREMLVRREENYIEGTPKIIVGKLQNNIQEIWTDDLKREPVVRLKELNSDERAMGYARVVVGACVRLARRYGFFIINENMVFFNGEREIFAWINPEVIENHVKIYLPTTPEGELAMIRSIIAYLKLWLKLDYNFLAETNKLEELLPRFDQAKARTPHDFKPRSPERDFLGTRKQGEDGFNRLSGNNLRLPVPPNLMENRSNREVKSPGKEENKLVMSMSYKQKPLIRNYQSSQEEQKVKNRTQSHNTDQLSSDKNAEEVEGHFQHKSFHNINPSTKQAMNQSLGLKSDKYFPNRTTSNKNHPIVQLISSQDQSPHEYKQNKILLEDHAAQEEHERERLRRMRESLDGIGQEVNELFFSNIESDGNKQEELKQIEQEFESLLD